MIRVMHDYLSQRSTCTNVLFPNFRGIFEYHESYNYNIDKFYPSFLYINNGVFSQYVLSVRVSKNRLVMMECVIFSTRFDLLKVAQDHL